MKIAVVDYGMGNLHSVAKAIHRVAKVTVTIEDTAAGLRQADRIVFPGQGAAGETMRALQQHDLVEPLSQLAADRPFLGICLGMQVLLQQSAENNGVPTLGLVSGSVVHLATLVEPSVKVKIPHMGWNTVNQQTHALWQDITADARFYFDHSYVVQPAIDKVTGWTDYGCRFPAAIGQDNWFAVQFHPEKSSHAGLQLLQNFVHWQP